ncbi:hypothetical protein B0A53_03513 [Rhodotorula sp. CCFEE 5036]|nr:hypothetical protein B0A53_03513 [Rhodotorula sp. CCFEE 5036]
MSPPASAAHPAPAMVARERKPWYSTNVTLPPWLLLLNLGFAIVSIFLCRRLLPPQRDQAIALADRFPEACEVRIANLVVLDENGSVLDPGTTVHRFVRGHPGCSKT